MPQYTYKCRNCENITTDVLPIESMHKPCEFPCEKCKQFSLYLQIQPVKMSYQGNLKTTQSFNDRLKDIKKNLPEGSSAQDSIENHIR